VTQKVAHEMLGRITKEDGFIPKGTKKKSTASSPILKQVCMRESGASIYLRHISQDIIDVLRIHFPQNYREIFTLAILQVGASISLEKHRVFVRKLYAQRGI